MFIGEKNMLNKVYILGSGGMARETYQIYKSLGKENKILGFLINEAKPIHKKLFEKPILELDNQDLSRNVKLINGIGSPLRKKWIKELEKKSFMFESAIHPTVLIGSNVALGTDLVIGANSVLTCDIHVGNHVIINVNVSIGHDCVIEDFVTISPGVNMGGGVRIGNGSFIGIGTTIIQRIKIGSNSFIGAGSVVVEDIPDNVLVYGNPARNIKKIENKDWENIL